jgi:hypothetical protein
MTGRQKGNGGPERGRSPVSIAEYEELAWIIHNTPAGHVETKS